VSPNIFRCEYCGRVVCNICYCLGDQSKTGPQSPLDALPRDPLDNIYHKLWDEIHSVNFTPEQFDEWKAKVPQLGCSCVAWLKEYLVSNPPQFGDWPTYAWKLHNAVNKKLGKPEFSWADCQNKYPTWKQVEGLRIGFASIGYESLGGTETFHQTLASRLPGVIGFASQFEMRGDRDALGVPSGSGDSAIASLVAESDVVVSWNIDWGSRPRPKRVIAVHHGSVDDIDGTSLSLHGNVIVCVNEDVATMLRTLTDKPVIYIENAVDPNRLKPRNQVETNGKKICLWSHRFSRDKRPQLAIEIAKHLPDDWHMVMTGHRGEKLDANDRVTILPPTHPGDWLSVASCFLSTTIFEGFGLSVAEAVCAGVPVVSTPTGIASRPGLAITVPIDASPEEWAKAIASSESHALPSQDLFSLDEHLAAWIAITHQAASAVA